jgi:hypothetical protein
VSVGEAQSGLAGRIKSGITNQACDRRIPDLGEGTLEQKTIQREALYGPARFAEFQPLFSLD